MDETVDIVLSGSLCNAFRAVDVDIGVGKIPAHLLTKLKRGSPYAHSLCRVVAANKVVYDIGMTNALLDRLGVSQVIFLTDISIVPRQSLGELRSYQENNSAQITGRFKVSLGHLLTVRNNNGASLRS